MANNWKPKKKFSDPTRLSRKVFDKYCDRMDVKLARVKEDYRADIVALLGRITTLEGVVAHLDDLLHGEIHH